MDRIIGILEKMEEGRLQVVFFASLVFSLVLAGMLLAFARGCIRAAVALFRGWPPICRECERRIYEPDASSNVSHQRE